jgi:asparagine synthase (glutamine-hydrolysing)
MCGLAGILGDSLDVPTRRKVLQAMARRLTPRGPDEQVTGQAGLLGYVFTRLAIIDPQTGGQPFRAEEGPVLVFANGEIYNHRSLWEAHLSDTHRQSQSDCAVLLGLYLRYGVEFAKLLDGMFAIAIWDGRTGMLHLIRDRVGIRPLVYARCGADVVFASEAKAILAHPHAPRRVDATALEILPTRAYPYPRTSGQRVTTFLEQVHHVLPGHVLTISDEGTCASQTFWSPPIPALVSDSIRDPADGLHSLVKSSVAAQLVSDAKIGLFLSGGTDSAYLAGLAAEAGHALDCFTLSTPELDEIGDTEAARRVCDTFGHRHHVLHVTQAAAERVEAKALATLEALAWIMDGPVFDVEILLKIHLHRVATARVPGLKSILLGQGADEFTGGYGALGSGGLKGFIEQEGGAGWQSRRFSDLAAYNLWHEDRTAAANGLESRVPFLSHMLIEYLLKISEDRWAFWFNDKRILRLAASSVLTDWMCWRRKTPFLPSSGAEKTVEATLLTALARGAAGPFCERYAPSEKARARLAAAAEDPAHQEIARAAIWAMSCTIFEAQAKAAKDMGFAPPELPPLDLVAHMPPDRGRARQDQLEPLQLAEGVELTATALPRPRLIARRGDDTLLELALEAAPRLAAPTDRLRLLDPGSLTSWLGFSPTEAAVFRQFCLAQGLAVAAGPRHERGPC